MIPVCTNCGERLKRKKWYACPHCNGPLLLTYDRLEDASWKDENESGVWKYHALLPTIHPSQRIYLGEGGTPLVRSSFLSKCLGIERLFFKLEGSGPTGSYKDRIAAVGLSWALENDRQACIGTSSGNAGAAAAAYAARADMPYHLVVLENMAQAKLDQALLFQPAVHRVAGFGSDPEVGQKVFDLIAKQANRRDWEVLITAFRYNPYAMEGVKTISFEIAEQLEEVPSHVYVPTGGAGLYVGVWKGFDELYSQELVYRKPKMIAVQPAGCSNIARAFAAGQEEPAAGASETEISGLQVPNPPDGKIALKIMQRGDGSALSVTDEEIWETQCLLAEKEGIFCEPAAAASVAGLIRAVQNKKHLTTDTVVCVITGSGLKDGHRMNEMVKDAAVPLINVDQLARMWSDEEQTANDGR